MALVLVPPQRQGVLFHIPQIWFGFENCRCHTCTQWGRKGSLLTHQGFLEEQCGLASRSENGVREQEKELGLAFIAVWDGTGVKLPHMGWGLHVAPSCRHRGREHLGFLTSLARCGRAGKRDWGVGKLLAAERQTLSQS